MMNLRSHCLRHSLFAVLFLIVSSACAETFTFRETTGDTIRYYNATRENTQQGIRIISNDARGFMEHLLGAAYESNRYVYKTVDATTSIIAQREANTIHCSGISNGKKIDRIVKLGRDPWCQEWSNKLAAFAQSGTPSTRFCAVNPPGWDTYLFEAFNKGVQNVVVDGVTVEAVRVYITLAGLLSFAWHGDYWFRSSDFRFIRFEGKTAPGSSKSVYEIVSLNVNTNPSKRKP